MVQMEKKRENNGNGVCAVVHRYGHSGCGTQVSTSQYYPQVLDNHNGPHYLKVRGAQYMLITRLILPLTGLNVGYSWHKWRCITANTNAY